MNEWKKLNPIFEYDQIDSRILQHSAWRGHCRFAYDLIHYYQPNTIVELGTHWGTSFFSMCQAVEDGKLPSSCYAVDTWVGDPHAGHYGNEVYDTVSVISTTIYPRFTHLLRATFDEAVMQFEDDSIQILHIDGFHQYDAVSHDYELWLPKLAENGIIMFHDISCHTPGFGVWKLWESLKEKLPSLQFEHSSGLGILFPKGITEQYAILKNQWPELKAYYESLEA
ncbi:class I SAM-dependent methyltransferase [Paenibacillus sp. D2_2]|uniref:class I SAM-dependent methyltransferase n=1 Tax=Paenibacillus sp. D2_2 TaxID=3073092 RepID=UPI0028168AE4|nr:class I SAM-dependent methyltransferase [Paenibacillus sp. D2_2]WMT43322.1 class I SAM-dependent methyltransferase [Paenibacillus sp. D2_2]